MEVGFSATRVREYMQAFTGGKPILCPAGGWTVQEMLMLAAAAAVVTDRTRQLDLVLKSKGKHREHVEAADAIGGQTLREILDLFVYAAWLIPRNAYEDCFDDEWSADVTITAEGLTSITPITGFRDPPETWQTPDDQ